MFSKLEIAKVRQEHPELNDDDTYRMVLRQNIADIESGRGKISVPARKGQLTKAKELLRLLEEVIA
jgi:hypothetical protein